MGQAYFPSDQSTGKISFHKTEEIAVSKADKYNRVKTWFMNYYKTSRFEDQFRVTKKASLFIWWRIKIKILLPEDVVFISCTRLKHPDW